MPTCTWTLDEICLRGYDFDTATLAETLYTRTCRSDFDSPGFCLLHLGEVANSVAFRQLMVDLKQQMSSIHEFRTGNRLDYLSAARFDQQITTKPHLDGGPDECFLMLGYEPSAIASELYLFDYARCAFDLELSPVELLAKHNPMFQTDYEILQRYSTALPCLSRTDFQIVCINNSSAQFSRNRSTWQGVLHTAKIVSPDDSKRRVINSTMIAPTTSPTASWLTDQEVQEFVNTCIVRRRGYDKPHLQDDS